VALPAGIILDTDVHPKASWPLTKATSLVAPPLGQGRSHPARESVDGTRWCAFGDHTLDPASRARRCGSCATFRDRLRHQEWSDSLRHLPTEVITALITSAQDSDALVKRLHGKYLVNQDLTTDELSQLFTAVTRTSDIAALAEDYLSTGL
jgi:hypothetical protein